MKAIHILLKTVAVLIILGGICFQFGLWSEYLDQPEPYDEIVECYDNYGNEIIGVDCIDENEKEPFDFYFMLSLFTLLIFPFAIVIYKIDI